MQTISVFFQGEHHKDVGHCEADAGATFAWLRAKLKALKVIDDDSQIFLEDQDDPIDDQCCLGEHAKSTTLKIHVHRRHKVEVKVMFNGEIIERRFPVSATIARVKKWAAIRKLKMGEEEASEHVLQVSGSHERPSPSVHIGTLVDCEKPLCLDLVPDERVNGSPGH
ncbi:hypothetical protein [Hyphomonas sp.]|uniref:hypothetical protein n=1 Tax=Hyphomonas sp. TaxID=87 RepID=UPI003F6EF2C3